MNKIDKPKYVGPPEIHDAIIMSLSESDNNLDVRIKEYEGKEFGIRFSNVRENRSNNPENMMLYALVEENYEENLKRYVFVNWDEEDPSSLEVIAEKFEIIE